MGQRFECTGERRASDPGPELLCRDSRDDLVSLRMYFTTREPVIHCDFAMVAPRYLAGISRVRTWQHHANKTAAHAGQGLARCLGEPGFER